MFGSRCCACRRRPICTLSRHRNAKIGKDERNGKKKRSFLASHGRIIACIRETMMHKISHSDKPNDAKFGRLSAAMPTDEGVRGGLALSEFFIKGRCFANHLTLSRLAIRAVWRCERGRFRLQNRPFRSAKRAVLHRQTAGEGWLGRLCKDLSNTGRQAVEHMAASLHPARPGPTNRRRTTRQQADTRRYVSLTSGISTRP